MNKGIRSGVFAKFAELNPLRIEGKFASNTAFRKEIVYWAVDAFNTTVQSASTAYNEAKKDFAKAHPELVAGLGRAPEKNNGGRKKKVVEAVATAEVADAEAAVQEFYTVKKKSTGEVVAEALSFEAAQAMIAKAAASKKAKLYWV